MNVKIESRLPTVLEFNQLRELAGWPVFSADIVSKAFANSFHGVCILNDENNIIGMGRVIGDGAIYLHIQDVIVHPDFQKLGIGKMVMDNLMVYVASVAGKNMMVGLMCSKGREKFYKKFNFIERPNEKFGAGMVMIME
jgi:ribosomal protein S18 acetylase RimI-like enzyme